MSTKINDYASNVTSGSGAVPAVRTATVTGTGIDFLQCDGPCWALQHVGAVSGTTPTLDGKIQESSDDAVYTDIAGATFTQVTATGTTPAAIVFQRTKRYLRYVGTIAGTTPSFACAAVIAQQLKQV